MFTVLSSKDLARFKRFQNSADRVIFAVSRRVDACPLLETLHWLPVSSRITFKILLHVLKILNSQAPGYLTELLSYYNPTRCLRSSSDTTHLVLHSSATAIDDKRFQIVAAKSWNLLPTEIRTVTSMGRSDKVSLWWVTLLINTRFRFLFYFIFFNFRRGNC